MSGWNGVVVAMSISVMKMCVRTYAAAFALLALSFAITGSARAGSSRNSLMNLMIATPRMAEGRNATITDTAVRSGCHLSKGFLGSQHGGTDCRLPIVLMNFLLR